MSRDCRNDCVETLLFPKKIENRPGLSTIDYRIGTYSDFREALLRRLNSDPNLSSWTHRQADDPGIALLEGASIIGDILTFYQELYANEAYLRSAKWRESISDLVRLLGYRLSPGLGGKATFAFEVKGDKPVVVPAGFPIKAQVEGAEQPVDFETTREFVAEPSLSRFNLYQPYTEPDLNPDTQELRIIYESDNTPDSKIQKGDQILLGDLNQTKLINSELIIVENTRELLGETLITFKGEIKYNHNTPVTAYKLNRSFRHFGYNAPREIVKIEAEQAKLHEISFERSLHKDTSANENATPKKIIYPTLSKKDIPLDSEVNDLASGQLIIIELITDVIFYESFTEEDMAYARCEKHVEECFLQVHIDKINPSAMTWGAMSGGTSQLTIKEDDLAAFQDQLRDLSNIPLDDINVDIRKIKIHEVVGEPFKVGAAREFSDNIEKNRLYFFGDYNSYKILKDRKIQLVKGDIVEEIQVLNITEENNPPGSPGLREVIVNRELIQEEFGFSYSDFPLENPIVTVYGNLVETTQGKTEKEAVLGNGDGRQTFQTFKLPKAPLTYQNSSSETPPEVPELQVYVNDRLWKVVSSFFGHGSKEQIYIVREDSDNTSWVQFGDGNTGARLPSGVKNIVARYRTGTGAYGALKEQTTVQPVGKIDRLKKIQLPGIATGGSEPESGDNAREAAPGKIQSLGRLVGLKDFERETLAISGVSKVTASWDLVDNVPAVILTVLMETGRDEELSEVREDLTRYNRCRGPQRYPIDVQPGKCLYVYIDAVYGINPSFREHVVEKAIKEALGVTGDEGNGIDGSAGLFGIHQRSFGQSEYATRIAGTIQNVEGVMWAEVKALGFLPENSDLPSELNLPSDPKPLAPGISCDNWQILSLYRDHLQLSASKVESTEEC